MSMNEGWHEYSLLDEIENICIIHRRLGRDGDADDGCLKTRVFPALNINGVRKRAVSALFPYHLPRLHTCLQTQEYYTWCTVVLQ